MKVAQSCMTLCNSVDFSSPWNSLGQNTGVGSLYRAVFNLGIFLEFSVAAAKSLQSCPTLCDPIDGSPPGSPVPGILQARTLE